MQQTLIIGGARSGKSARALKLAESAGESRAFIATAEALDSEMADRIERHKMERSDSWSTIEAPLDLVGAIASGVQAADVCVVDCLTLWLSNLMYHDRDVERECAHLCEAVSACAHPIILVSNEVGLGLVPETPLGRRFRDAQGRLNQDLAGVCAKVEFIAAGLPIALKS